MVSISEAELFLCVSPRQALQLLGLDLANRLFKRHPLAGDLRLSIGLVAATQLADECGARSLVEGTPELRGVFIKTGNRASDEWEIVSHRVSSAPSCGRSSRPPGSGGRPGGNTSSAPPPTGQPYGPRICGGPGHPVSSPRSWTEHRRPFDLLPRASCCCTRAPPPSA